MVRFDQFLIVARGRSRSPCKGFIVHVIKPEPWSISFNPFKIIKKGPVIVPSNVDSFFDSEGDFTQMGKKIGLSEVIVAICDAVLGDVDWKLISRGEV